MNERVRTFLFVTLGFGAAGALLGAPHALHLLDRGSVPATVAQIASGKLASRNVTVNAMVFADRGLRQVVTQENSQNSPRTSFYMPITDPGAADGPTRVVVHTWYNEVFDAVEHPERPIEFKGTVRDVLWEGLEGEVKENLAALHPLAGDVKLLELESTGHVDDLLWGVGAPVAGLLLGLLAASNALKQMKVQG